MSQKLPSEESIKAPSLEETLEETLARYLADNPDFFERHVDLLTTLRIPHYESGRAVSLIERQVEALRHKHRDLHRQLRDLIACARQNDILSERLHHFALAMIAAASFDDVLSTAQDMWRQEFKLEAVAILLTGGPESAAGRPGLVAAGDRRLDELLQRYTPAKPVIGAKLDAETFAYLFGDHTTIGSWVVAWDRAARPGYAVCWVWAATAPFILTWRPYLTKLGDLLWPAWRDL